MTKDKTVKPVVYVIDDDADMCQSIRWLLESVNLNVETFTSAPDFLEIFSSDLLGCIILDARMPKMSGLELQQQLNSKNSLLPILFLTGHGDAPMAVQAMKAGAVDFLTKPYNGQTLLDKTHRALETARTRYDREIANLSVKKRLDKLTPRESEVMWAVIDGKRSIDIAKDLGIAAKTVELHRAKVMEKMEVFSSVALATLVTNYVHSMKLNHTNSEPAALAKA